MLRIAQRDRIPVTCRGGGLTTEGESVAASGILLDLKGMNRLLECDGAHRVGRGRHDVAPGRRSAAPARARLHQRAAQHALHRRRHARRRRHRRQLAAPRLRRGSGRRARGRDADRRDRPREGRRRLPGARAPRLRPVRRHHQGADQGAPVPADGGAPLPLHRHRRRARRHDAPRRAGRGGRLRHPDAARRRRRADSRASRASRRTFRPALRNTRRAARLSRRSAAALRDASVAAGRDRLPDAAEGGPAAGAARSAVRARRRRARSHGGVQPPDLALLGRAAGRHPGSRDHEGELRGGRPARHRRLQALLPATSRSMP